MAYKIAVASIDGIHIDQSFREAKKFLIFQVNEDGNYDVREIRKFKDTHQEENEKKQLYKDNGHVCGDGAGCGGTDSPKLSLIDDCRCLVCTQIGFKACRYLEKKAVSAFEIDCNIKEALEKITGYFKRVDSHPLLTGISSNR